MLSKTTQDSLVMALDTLKIPLKHKKVSIDALRIVYASSL
ncbi:hypothetical protein THF5H11_180015 [Vibrio jasicida]|nr:hypothetical protein THF5H11_180015 [Vibrio jasicida]CAH1607151.1 hypothetical protein THF5G08_310028 [Vibrio jasicida]